MGDGRNETGGTPLTLRKTQKNEKFGIVVIKRESVNVYAESVSVKASGPDGLNQEHVRSVLSLHLI